MVVQAIFEGTTKMAHALATVLAGGLDGAGQLLLLGGSLLVAGVMVLKAKDVVVKLIKNGNKK